MCAWIIKPARGLVENAVAPVIWTDCIAAMALHDGVVTTYYCSIRDSLYADAAECNVEVIIKRRAHSLVEDVAQAARAIDHIRPPPLVPGHTLWKPHLVTS